MDVVVYDDRDQRYVPLLVSLVATLLVATLVGGLVYFLGRQPAAASPPASGVSAPQAGVQETAVADCRPALERAETALGIATRLEGALGTHTAVMDELLAERLTREQVLDRSLPALTATAKDRQAYLAAVTAYQEARAECEQ